MRIFLLCLTLLSFYFINAQVGIGTEMPNPSSQLEIVSASKGVLIPQIALLDDTDSTTISAGNVESLLVFNTTSSGALSPGYYFWNAGKWRRLISNSDLNNLSDNLIDHGDGTFTHTALDGTTITFDANTTSFRSE